MIVKYIDRAMSKAVYEKLGDGSFSGKIPQCPGVIAFGETLYRCEQELKASLEGWLIVKLRHGDKLPIISNISLNKKNPSVEAVKAGISLNAIVSQKLAKNALVKNSGKNTGVTH